jgi:hypothetical protein
MIGADKTDKVLGLAIAHGLKGKTVSTLSRDDILTLADFLQDVGLIEGKDIYLMIQYRAHMYRVVQVAWIKYQKALGDTNLFSETQNAPQ